MAIKCQNCKEDLPSNARDAIEDGDRDEIVMHVCNPDDEPSFVVSQTDYYCNGSCAAAELDRRPIEQRLEAISEEIRERDSLGECGYYGDLGFHTFFNPPRTDYGIGMTTAMHLAFEKTTDELWLESDIVEDNQGEVTPETVAAEAEHQLEEFIGQFRFFELYAENLEEVLRDAEEKYNGVSWS